MSKIFGEFVASLNERGVRYLVIGGWATAFHGHPRFTKDPDVLIDRTPRNAAATRDAIYAGAIASFASLGDLLASKRAVGRPQDLADVSMLERRSFRKAAKRHVK